MLDAGVVVVHDSPSEDRLLGHRFELLPDECVSLHGLKFRNTGGIWFVTALDDVSAYLDEQLLLGMQPLVDGSRIRIGWMVLELLHSDEYEERYHEVIYRLVLRNGLSGLARPRLLRDIIAQQGGCILGIDRPCSTPEEVMRFAQRLTQALQPDEVAAQVSTDRYEVLVPPRRARSRADQLTSAIGVPARRQSLREV